MKLYKHDSYEEYVKAQVDLNEKKLGQVFIRKEIAQLIALYVENNIYAPEFGICHGVRNAWEVKCFRELLNFNIIGTEIADTATQFDDTIKWDFHDVKEEWINNVDFIYSNSLDHSYDPEYCLAQWVSCLSNKGMCFIEWTFMSKSKPSLKSMKADCFGADLDEYKELISKNFKIIDELEMDLKEKENRVIFVVK